MAKNTSTPYVVAKEKEQPGPWRVSPFWTLEQVKARIKKREEQKAKEAKENSLEPTQKS